MSGCIIFLLSEINTVYNLEIIVKLVNNILKSEYRLHAGPIIYFLITVMYVFYELKNHYQMISNGKIDNKLTEIITKKEEKMSFYFIILSRLKIMTKLLKSLMQLLVSK